MIAISIKIKKEDKKVMIRVLDGLNRRHVNWDDLSQIVAFDAYIDIRSKIMSSQFNDRPIRLNLILANFFLFFLKDMYSVAGSYELANSILLTAEIERQVSTKIIELKNNH